MTLNLQYLASFPKDPAVARRGRGGRRPVLSLDLGGYVCVCVLFV